MKKYPKQKDSGIAWLREIPEQWRIESFKNILTERNEKNNPVRTKEILSLSINKGVTLYAEKTTNLDRFKDDVTKYKLAHKGDLVLNSMNMIVGAVGVSDYFGCVSPVYYTFYGNNNDTYTTRFYEYLFRTKTVQSVLYSLGRGLIAIDRGEGKYNTLRLKVSRDDLRSMRLPFPNISEQIAIVSYLDFKTEKINRFIAKKKQLIQLLTEQKSAIINKTVTRGINPEVKLKTSAVEWLGDIPQHWEVKPLKYYVTYNDEALPNSTNKNLKLNYIDISNVNKDGEIDEIIEYTFQDAPSRARRIVKKGDVILSTVRTYLKAIAKIEDDKDVIVSTGFAVLRPKHNIDSEFLNSAVRANYFIEEVCANSFGVSYPAINASDLVTLKLAVPNSIQEQKKISHFIKTETTKIDKTISTIEKEISLVEEYKAALIVEAVTGKIDVRDFKVPVKEESLAMVAEEAENYNKAN
ncbi:restriction endonuclease subunit S [Nonlabens ulvanivorans]|uniref:restriction endonuclease subunit S n=1 Tax=Nonlabens ulvanivorans TaxID=906888 RepID=UPI00068E4EA6|nr:restriction endonuclease subunit S [Nonlabens ulvanivorans]